VLQYARVAPALWACSSPLLPLRSPVQKNRFQLVSSFKLSMPPVEDIVDSFQSVSLAEMDRVALMDRNDTKYVFHREQLPALLENMAEDYQVLSVEGLRASPYSTLYFDTPEQDFFLQHHNGKLSRHKVRMRTYLASNLAFLEIKTKTNKGRTIKQRMQIEGSEESMSPQALEFLHSTLGILPKLVPQLRTFFSRITLVHRTQPERVTFDFDIVFSHDHRTKSLSQNPVEGCRRPGNSEQPDGFGTCSKRWPEIAIAEVKQDRNFRNSPAQKRLRQLRIQPMPMSKYCLGSVLLKPALKYNRFKPKLIAIRKIASR